MIFKILIYHVRRIIDHLIKHIQGHSPLALVKIPEPAEHVIFSHSVIEFEAYTFYSLVIVHLPLVIQRIILLPALLVNATLNLSLRVQHLHLKVCT